MQNRFGTRWNALFSVIALAGFAGGCGASPSSEVEQTTLAARNFDPNGFPHKNPAGFAATFSTQGVVSLTGEYFQAQGTNGRSCVTCHLANEAWAITPGSIQDMFDQTGGLHPIFNPLDANNPNTLDATTAHPRTRGWC